MSARLVVSGFALLVLAGPAAAAGEGGGPSLVWQSFNFLLILVVIGFFARKPIAEYLAARREGIRQEIETSAELLTQAEAKLSDWNERTGRLDAELGEIREASRHLAEQEREEILAQARATAERIRTDAASAVDQELRRARAELADEAADLAVELAGKLIRDNVDDTDQQRLFDEFLERIQGSGDARPERRS